jgi:hypothetical protein
LGLPNLKRGNGSLPFPKEEILEKASASLQPKRDHIIRLFARLGLEMRQLQSKELVELFYRLYNEETAANQKVQSLEYDTPVINSKIKIQ